MHTSKKAVFTTLLLAIAFPVLCHAYAQGPLRGPNSLTFQMQAVGVASPTQQITLQNVTAYWVSISSITVTGDFQQTNNCANGVNFTHSCTMWVTFTPTTAGTRTGLITIKGTYQSGPNFYPYTETISLGGEGVFSGFVNPKYQILGVWYAAPGSPSNVCYGSNTVVGNSTAVSSSFSDSLTKSVSTSQPGLGIPGYFSSSRTTTNSTTYTQEQDTSSSVEVKQMASDNQCLGPFGSGVSFTGLDHDWDYIFLWLNPIATFAIDPNVSPSTVVWTGYGWDENDPTRPDLDVFGIPVGCLNRDFKTTNPPEWTTCQSYFQCPNGPLARCWALTNTDGSGPGLTGFGTPCNPAPNPPTDVCTILAADQFGSSSFTFTPPPQGSFTSPDGRFTACDANHAHCNTVIDYEVGLTKNYTQGYTTTTTQSQGYKNTYSTTYSVENQFKGTSFFDGFMVDLKTSTTLTWENQFNQSTNNSNGQTSSFNIVGPSPGYTGRSQFVVYQDNLYGTFMFNPQ